MHSKFSVCIAVHSVYEGQCGHKFVLYVW